MNKNWTATWAIETYDCASTRKWVENTTTFYISTRQERCNIDVWNIAHVRLMNVIFDWDDGCLVRECQRFIPTWRSFGSNCHTCGLELEETRSLSPAWKIFETCSALFLCAKVAGQLARSLSFLRETFQQLLTKSCLVHFKVFLSFLTLLDSCHFLHNWGLSCWQFDWWFQFFFCFFFVVEEKLLDYFVESIVDQLIMSSL